MNKNTEMEGSALEPNRQLLAQPKIGDIIVAPSGLFHDRHVVARVDGFTQHTMHLSAVTAQGHFVESRRRKLQASEILANFGPHPTPVKIREMVEAADKDFSDAVARAHTARAREFERMANAGLESRQIWRQADAPRPER